MLVAYTLGQGDKGYDDDDDDIVPYDISKERKFHAEHFDIH